MTKKERAAAVTELLKSVYPEAVCALHYTHDYELLFATRLSAQCTDKRVNAVTRELFEEYGTVQAMAALTPGELEPMIRSCGLGPSKAKNIVAASHILLRDYGGEVPREIGTLQTLPGVGRKTANVVASVAYGVPAIAVDTHVFRVSNRIGFAAAKDVAATEKQLMALIPEEKWSKAHHLLIWHGRRICTARSPQCGECFLRGVCLHQLTREADLTAENKRRAPLVQGNAN